MSYWTYTFSHYFLPPIDFSYQIQTFSKHNFRKRVTDKTNSASIIKLDGYSQIYIALFFSTPNCKTSILNYLSKKSECTQKTPTPLFKWYLLIVLNKQLVVFNLEKIYHTDNPKDIWYCSNLVKKIDQECCNLPMITWSKFIEIFPGW